MKRISEQNIFPNYNLVKEYQKIEYLFSEFGAVFIADILSQPKPGMGIAIESYVSKNFFSWHLRGTFISIHEMRTDLGIDKNKMNKQELETETVLIFIQFVANCIQFTKALLKQNFTMTLAPENHINIIFENIYVMLTNLGAELHFDEKKNEFYICYTDEISNIVSILHPDAKYSISDYLKIENRNDLQRKGEILCTLYKKFESVKENLKGTEFHSLSDDTGFLFNKSGIRHWVEEDKIAAETFEKMTDSEKEEWYDKTFNLFLACMAVLPYIKIKPEIKIIKQV